MICRFCKGFAYQDDDGYRMCDPCNTRFYSIDNNETIRVFYFKEPSIFYSIVMAFETSGNPAYTYLWYRDKYEQKDMLSVPKTFPEITPSNVEEIANRIHKLRIFL